MGQNNLILLGQNFMPYNSRWVKSTEAKGNKWKSYLCHMLSIAWQDNKTRILQEFFEWSTRHLVSLGKDSDTSFSVLVAQHFCYTIFHTVVFPYPPNSCIWVHLLCSWLAQHSYDHHLTGNQYFFYHTLKRYFLKAKWNLLGLTLFEGGLSHIPRMQCLTVLNGWFHCFYFSLQQVFNHQSI